MILNLSFWQYFIVIEIFIPLQKYLKTKPFFKTKMRLIKNER